MKRKTVKFSDKLTQVFQKLKDIPVDTNDLCSFYLEGGDDDLLTGVEIGISAMELNKNVWIGGYGIETDNVAVFADTEKEACKILRKAKT